MSEQYSIEEQLKSILASKELTKKKQEFLNTNRSEGLIKSFFETDLVEIVRVKAKNLNEIGKGHIEFKVNFDRGMLEIRNEFNRASLHVDEKIFNPMTAPALNTSELVFVCDLPKGLPITSTMVISVNDDVQAVWKSEEDNTIYDNNALADFVFKRMLDSFQSRF